MAWVTLMGLATVHDDLATKKAKNFYSEEQLRQYAVKPPWLEIVAPDTAIKGDRAKWRPAGLEVARSRR